MSRFVQCDEWKRRGWSSAATGLSAVQHAELDTRKVVADGLGREIQERGICQLPAPVASCCNVALARGEGGEDACRGVIGPWQQRDARPGVPGGDAPGGMGVIDDSHVDTLEGRSCPPGQRSPRSVEIAGCRDHRVQAGTDNRVGIDD